MANLELTCPHCRQELKVPEEFLGQAVECPSCGGALRIAGPASSPSPAPAVARRGGGVGQGAVIAAAVTLAVAVAVMFLSTGRVVCYVPIFGVAAILALVAMSQGKGGAGGLMLLVSIVLPLVWQFAVVAPASSASVAASGRKVGEGLDGIGQSLRDALAPSKAPEKTVTPEERQDSLQRVEVLDLEAKVYRVARRKVTGVKFKLRNNGRRSLSDVEVTVTLTREDGSLLTEQKFHPLQVNLQQTVVKPGATWEMAEGSFLPFEAPLSEADVSACQVAARVTGVNVAD